MDNKTHFILSTKSYMLLHHGAIFGGIIRKKDRKSNMYLGASHTCLLYVFDSAMEAKVYMRRCGTDGLERETVVLILRALNVVNCFIEIFLRAGEFIRNQEVLNVQFANAGS
jgi:hypothetical protein